MYKGWFWKTKFQTYFSQKNFSSFLYSSGESSSGEIDFIKITENKNKIV